MNFAKFQKLVEERTGFRTMDKPMASGDYFSDSCGDMYTYYLQVGPGDVIEDVTYFTTGCGFGTATCSLLVDLARGKTIDEAYAITDAMIEAELDGYPEKKRDYPSRSIAALQAAIDDYRKKRSAGAITDAMLESAAAAAAVASAERTARGTGTTQEDAKREPLVTAPESGKLTISLR